MLDELKKKPEATRRKVAFSVSLFVTLVIFSGWVYNKGYLDYDAPIIAQNSQETSEKQEVSAPSPIENTTSSFDSIFAGIRIQYDALKESVAAVLVPFITGIDVYNKGDSE